MVGTLARLQLTLAWRGMRSSVGRLVSSVIGGLYGGALLVAAVAGLVALRGQHLDALRGPLLVLGFALITLGWPLGTVLAAGSNELLDPGRFALFPTSARALLPGLFVAALLGPGGLGTAVLGLASVVSWSGHPSAAVAASAGAGLGLATCVLASRAGTSSLSRLLNTRRFRDAGVVVFFVVVMAASLVTQLLVRRLDAPELLGGALDGPARVVSWTPVGWAWALPWDVARGDWPALVGHGLLAMGLVAGLARLWAGQLATGLVSPLGGAQQGGRVHRGRLDRILPVGPVGSVAARELRYWHRDPRRLVQLVSAAMVPLLVVVPTLLNGGSDPSGPLVPAFAPVIGAVVLGSPATWSLSYDGSALWMQVLTGVTGRQDRLGRALALGLLAAPVLLAACVPLVGSTGQWALLPGVLGATACGLLGALGTGAWVGAVWQQAMPATGGNVFARGSGASLENMAGSFAAIAIPVLVTVPSAALCLLGRRAPIAGWLALPVGVLIGGLACWGGIVSGGRHLDRHWPEILAKVRESSV